MILTHNNTAMHYSRTTPDEFNVLRGFFLDRDGDVWEVVRVVNRAGKLRFCTRTVHCIGVVAGAPRTWIGKSSIGENLVEHTEWLKQAIEDTRTDEDSLLWMSRYAPYYMMSPRTLAAEENVPAHFRTYLFNVYGVTE
ncbi:hypothetical protein SEA_GODONK_211 [Gordonia phage GodonK]|uniref:Uncharacterized protein n=1 Tax=Gordonia phage GodonK TaxID=2562192 RepID=A0A4D6E2A6_9CAUD|nr:hypothetical protein HOV33_gp157 [Gordonia phage GodonK]QBZ72799.1 hypothetical protein SEA_GODONK_211 [Gordonia phage GodonK]